MTLGREPQAKVSISQLNGKPGKVDPTHQLNTDSASYEYYLNPDNTGVALVATYTGLKNSYYYDSDGNKHNIAKIVRTFSNVTKQNWVHSWDWEKNPENNGNPYIWLYDDPTDGFWYYFASGITVTDQFFDENGNPINLNNDAWLAVTSLNNQGANNKVPANDADVEQVTALSGGEAYALLGSSVTNHNGTLYANSNNTNGTGHNTSDWWDHKGDNEYYGSGLIKLSGNSVSLRFSTHYDPSFTGATSYNVWATTTTIIPETPGPRKPEPKYTTINYHYDTPSVSLLLYS